MTEVLSLVSNGFVIPALVFLWMKLDKVEKSNKDVLEWLQKYCPHCGAVRIFSGRD